MTEKEIIKNFERDFNEEGINKAFDNLPDSFFKEKGRSDIEIHQGNQKDNKGKNKIRNSILKENDKNN